MTRQIKGALFASLVCSAATLGVAAGGQGTNVASILLDNNTAHFYRGDGVFATPAGGSSPPFNDNAALVQNNSDNTKKLIFDASLLTTATTRTFKFPDITGDTVATIDGGQTFTSATWHGTIIDITRGGLGINASGVTNGQLAIGSSTGSFVLAVPTAGTQIDSIATGAGSLTVNAALPRRYIEGLLCNVTVKGTKINVSPGTCRDSQNAKNMDATGIATTTSAATITVTANGAGGADSFNYTWCNTGLGTGTTVVAGADLSAGWGTRALSGTITTSTTSVTGTNTFFLVQLSVGDMVGNSTNGWSRVTAIASNTACTIVATLPGGSIATAAAATCIENPTFQINGSATFPANNPPNTLSSDGKTLVVGGSAPATANGVPIRLGPILNKSHVWLEIVGGSTVMVASTQRTTPYSLSGTAATSTRRLWGFVCNTNNQQIPMASQITDGLTPTTRYLNSTGDLAVGPLTGASATSYTAVDLGTSYSSTYLVPPFVTQVTLNSAVSGSVSGSNVNVFFQARNGTLGAPNNGNGVTFTAAVADTVNIDAVTACDQVQVIDYKVGGSGVTVTTYVTSYTETR